MMNVGPYSHFSFTKARTSFQCAGIDPDFILIAKSLVAQYVYFGIISLSSGLKRSGYMVCSLTFV